MECKAKPFVKWVGGKRQLLPDIEKRLPALFSTSDNITYIEPFVGGGAVFFYILNKYRNIKKAVINDINSKLIKAYICIRDNPNELISSLTALQKEYYKITNDNERKDFYLSIRNAFNNEELTDIDNTSFIIFLNRTCFNGLYRVNTKGHFNVPFGKYSNPKICDTETILADSLLLQDVEIISGDFENIFRFATNDTFIYLDPPYRPLNTTSSFNSYNKDCFDDNEQIRLKKFIDKLNYNGFSFMLSNSDGKGKDPSDTFFDDLYHEYIIERVYATRAINSNPNKRGKLTELLIRNYR